MAIFKLRRKGEDISNAELIEASKTNLDLEEHLESWLEQSPWAVSLEPFLWIGRQTTASIEDYTIFPDLLGIDKDGFLVIVELKKERTPRDVIAQLLEYAAWANELSDEAIAELAYQYFSSTPDLQRKNLREVFCEIFEADELPPLNRRLRLFIVAEEISSTVSKVCHFLRMSHDVDISCIEFSIYQTESGEILVSSEKIVGQEDLRGKQVWSGEKTVKQVVWEAVRELTQENKDYIFSPKEVAQLILKKYPTFNKSTVSCQIISDCVNHTSRHYYPGGKNRYWWIERGKYRLYDPKTDKIQHDDSEKEIIEEVKN